MDLIKRILLSLVFILFLPSVLIADVLDDELPGNVPVQVKEKAREVIRLGVENQGIIKMTQIMLQNRFSEKQMIRAYEIVGEARKNGLPEEPVMDKLYEGIGKRIQSENIIMAMEKVQERYKTASQYAHQMSSNNEQAGVLTQQVAECMSAGMTDKHIDRMSRTLSSLKTQNSSEKSSLQIQTLRTAKTMARLGATSQSVADAVQTALQSGYNQNNMKRLENAFVVQARARYNPTQIAESFSRGISSGVSVDDLGQRNYMNSGNAMGVNSYGNGVGTGTGQRGTGGSTGGSGSGGSGRGSGGGRR